jgi:N-glycosylase/DNA lyase
MQYGAVILGTTAVQIELPSEDDEVVPGVRWGAIEAFPTPAYWAYQVLARRAQGTRINYRLGTTLREEVGACLLGGHGIPASVGLAAFEVMRAHGAFTGAAHGEDTLFDWLSAPVQVGERTVRYRFARQKAKYLAAALAKMHDETPPMASGRQLRDWLTGIPGIGFKTASWVARNWLDADDVAILDIHLLRAGFLAGFFPQDLTVERHYLQLESMFITFSEGLGVRPSELDAIIWWEMMSSAGSVSQIFEDLQLDAVSGYVGNRRRANKRNSNSADQLFLI